MTRKFDATPATPPSGPLPEPPAIPERKPSHVVTRPESPPVQPPVRIQDDRPLSVRRLIELLQQAVSQDPSAADFEVSSEGCDCTGAAYGIEIYAHGKMLTVTREPTR